MNNYCMQRGWMDHAVLQSDEPYSKAMAWIWLIEHSCWKEQTVRIMGKPIKLKRGQLSFSERFLAAKWNRTQAWVHRFTLELKSASMIASDAASGQSVITICNYCEHQLRPKGTASASESLSASAMNQKANQRRIPDLIPDNTKGAETTAYAFDGKIIRLNAKDLAAWKQSFATIPDLTAELVSLDAWLSNKDAATQSRWFPTTARRLSLKHQEILAAQKAATAILSTPGYLRRGQAAI